MHNGAICGLANITINAKHISSAGPFMLVIFILLWNFAASTDLDETLVVLDHVGKHAEDAEELVRALLGEHRVVPSLVVLRAANMGNC